MDISAKMIFLYLFLLLNLFCKRYDPFRTQERRKLEVIQTLVAKLCGELARNDVKEPERVFEESYLGQWSC